MNIILFKGPPLTSKGLSLLLERQSPSLGGFNGQTRAPREKRESFTSLPRGLGRFLARRRQFLDKLRSGNH